MAGHQLPPKGTMDRQQSRKETSKEMYPRKTSQFPLRIKWRGRRGPNSRRNQNRQSRNDSPDAAHQEQEGRGAATTLADPWVITLGAKDTVFSRCRTAQESQQIEGQRHAILIRTGATLDNQVQIVRQDMSVGPVKNAGTFNMAPKRWTPGV